MMALLGVALAYSRPRTIFDIIDFAFVGLGATLGLPLTFLVLWLSGPMAPHDGTRRVCGWPRG
ncbi:hypothetical protein [Salinibacter altiplanensis]|uniref:hypothetical protein n=1 Tax=Salinibacter altiplanensis TaxID=1803181 RepID=UPI001E489D61|nr:hypothetical protein [Salinibacter altiplanensis]